jgi:PAS domain-containing protein
MVQQHPLAELPKFQDREQYESQLSALAKTEPTMRNLPAVPTEYKELVDILSVVDIEHQSVSVAEMSDDCPLIFVSTGFERLTGFERKDILGRNCRFLNQDLGLSTEHRMGLAEACCAGSHFLAVLTNQRKDGSVFENLLDLRTLEIGVFAENDKPARVLVGIQGEVNEGRTLDHWMRDMPTIVHEVLEKMTSAIHSESENCQLLL